MKKMFTLVMTLFAFSALFAQRDKPYHDNGNTVYNDRRYADDNDIMNHRPDRAVDMRSDEGRWNDNGRINEADRRAETDRINRDYNNRVDDYRNNQRMNRWQRDQAVERLRKERAEKLKAFGGGVLLGGILGVLIGSQR